MRDEIKARWGFFGIDRPAVRQRIRRLGRFAGPHLDEIVRTSVVRAASLQGVDLDANHKTLVDLLIRHYRMLLDLKVDDEIEENFHLLASAFSGVGHDTRMFLSIGALVMRSVLIECWKKMFWRPFELAKCGLAMGSIFSFDIAVALHLQIEQERAALRNRAAMIESTIREFRAEVDDVTKSVDALTNQLTMASETVDAATADTAKRSDGAAAAIAVNVDALQMSSHTIEELGASIRQISDQAVLGANLASDAVSAADLSGRAMRELSGALGNIDAITHMIGAIAGQTNLLALNATIEAARAGEAGRGFAVVASEVKGLVGQVETATADIKSILSGVRSASDSVQGEMNTIGQVIGSLSGATASVSVAVQQQRDAVDEIRGHIETVVAKNRELELTIASLADSSMASAREARTLTQNVRSLRDRSNSLEKAFDRLAVNLRAS